MAEKGGSCESCKKKKCKCDRKLPSCGQCEGSKSICLYAESNKRGIPTGYLGLLEQRLSETEVLLYHALSELRALRLGAFSGSSGLPHDFNTPDPIPRDVNMSKHARMKEWKEHPLKKPEDAERWREFMGDGGDMSHVIGAPLRQKDSEDLIDRTPPPDHQCSTDPALAYHDTDTDINVATGLIGLSRSHPSINDPGSSPMAAMPNQPGFHAHLSSEGHHPSHDGVQVEEFGMIQDIQRTVIDPAIEEHMSNSGWEATPLEITRQQVGSQDQPDLVRSRQLSSAFRNIYY